MMKPTSLVVFFSLAWLSTVTGMPVHEFKDSKDPFHSDFITLNKQLRVLNLPTLSGAIDSENADSVRRVASMGGWGSSVWTVYFKEGKPTLVTHSWLEAESSESKGLIVKTRRLTIDTEEKWKVVSGFDWDFYQDVVRKVEAGKIEPVPGDDIPFTLVEHIDGKSHYSGVYLHSNLHVHIEKMEVRLGRMVDELKRLDAGR